MQVWVDIDRGDDVVETRSVEGTPKEVVEQVAFWARTYGTIRKVTAEDGTDVTATYVEEPAWKQAQRVRRADDAARREAEAKGERWE